MKKARFPGVRRKRNRFEARVVIDGKRHSLGVFETAVDAHQAYLSARAIEDAKKPTPYYARHERPSAERLRELLDYDPDTGVFIHAGRAGVLPGAIAGTIRRDGYRNIRVDGRKYFAHQLAWLYMTGEWPPFYMDHRDGQRDNNRFKNLRPASRAENHQNTALRNNNSTGFHGVSWHRHQQKFCARIMINRKAVHLGYFSDPLEAHQAYLAAKQNLHQFQPVPRDL